MRGTFAYVTIGGLNQVKVFRTDDFTPVATIAVGKLPHGIWPSGDGSRIYVGLENADAVAVIDTATNKVVANVPVGQAPQALTYVPDAVGEGDGRQGLQPLGVAGQAASLTLRPVGPAASAVSTTVTLFDQGLLQVLQAGAVGLAPRQPYVLALSQQRDGSGPLQPLANFMTNPAGAAVVNAIGPIRQLVQADAAASRRYLVIAPVVSGAPGQPAQVQADGD
jgi:YVTN family beta-propeller protein